MADAAKVIKSFDQFPDTPRGKHERWDTEITASLKMLEDFHEQSRGVIERFLDDRGEAMANDSRVNLFWANTKTAIGAMYAQLPKVDVKRKFDDMDDDVARVTGLITERALNYDIQNDANAWDATIRNVLQDRILPGLGVARIFYEADTEQVESPPIVAEDGTVLVEGVTTERVTREAVPSEHYYWQDVCWSWARTWSELRWLAFRNYMSKDEAEERFGKDKVKDLTFRQQTISGEKESEETSEVVEKGEIWEIWCKENNYVYWYAEGATVILDEKEDPLELENFWPCPEFLMANTTTSFLMPKADYLLMQDLYNEVDLLQTRISILTEAVKVVGVYDSSSEGIKRMLAEGVENELIPVDNWAMFAEKGGIQGQIDWLPVEAVVNAIINLRQLREDNIILLEKVTGMSDILTGVGTNAHEGVGTQRLKASFGSVRPQAVQDEVVRFVSGLAALKAEVMSKHFQPETIAAYANLTGLTESDRQYIGPAMELFQNWEQAALKISIKSESMAMVDYAQLQGERTAYIEGLSLFMQSAGPLVQVDPGVTPYLLELLKWGLAGFKGADYIEGVLDEAIKVSKEAAKNPKPDPNAAAAAAEKELETMRQQFETKKMQMDMQREQMKGQLALATLKAKSQADLMLVKTKLQADLMLNKAKSDSSIDEQQAEAVFNTKEMELNSLYEREQALFEHTLTMDEIEAQHENAEMETDSED